VRQHVADRHRAIEVVVVEADAGDELLDRLVPAELAFLDEQPDGTVSLVWLVAGNVLYYALGIGLAFALRDNRAFCKYLCPVAVPLKAGARWSLMKIGGDAAQCHECGACERICPMDVPVREFVRNGRRVESTECILCQTSVHACPRQALSITLRQRRPVPELIQVGTAARSAA
jgi:polyferredoxin